MMWMEIRDMTVTVLCGRVHGLTGARPVTMVYELFLGLSLFMYRVHLHLSLSVLELYAAAWSMSGGVVRLLTLRRARLD